ALLDPKAQGINAFGTEYLDIGTMRKQQLHRGNVVAHDRLKQRRHTVPVALVGIGLKVEEKLDQVGIALARRARQRRISLQVALVDVRAVIDKELHARSIVGVDRLAQLGIGVRARGKPRLKRLECRRFLGGRRWGKLGRLRNLVVAAVGRQGSFHHAAAALHQRNTVIREDLLDLRLVILEREIEDVLKHGVGLAYANGKVELKRNSIFPEVYRLKGDGLALGLDPAGEWTPHGSEVELSIHHLLDLIPGLMLDVDVGVMADGLDRHIVEDAVLQQNFTHS